MSHDTDANIDEFPPSHNIADESVAHSAVSAFSLFRRSMNLDIWAQTSFRSFKHFHLNQSQARQSTFLSTFILFFIIGASILSFLIIFGVASIINMFLGISLGIGAFIVTVFCYIIILFPRNRSLLMLKLFPWKDLEILPPMTNVKYFFWHPPHVSQHSSSSVLFYRSDSRLHAECTLEIHEIPLHVVPKNQSDESPIFQFIKTLDSTRIPFAYHVIVSPIDDEGDSETGTVGAEEHGLTKLRTGRLLITTFATSPTWFNLNAKNLTKTWERVSFQAEVLQAQLQGIYSHLKIRRLKRRELLNYVQLRACGGGDDRFFTDRL
ncbi:MAG: hypothetical protein ACTSRW_13745 [Candidatus Helarchaeota archaeon]